MHKPSPTVRFPGAHAFCAAIAQDKSPQEASIEADLLRERLREIDRELYLNVFRTEFFNSI